MVEQQAVNLWSSDTVGSTPSLPTLILCGVESKLNPRGWVVCILRKRFSEDTCPAGVTQW